MELVASLLLLLVVYFFGSLSLIQEVIQPKVSIEIDQVSHKKHIVSNHTKILLLSFTTSLLPTTIAYFLFF